MTNLKCPFNHELLSAYASGNGSAQDRGVVERHLANCGHCRREVLELEKSWWALDVWRDEDIAVQPRFDVLKNRIQANRQPVSLMQRAKPYWHQANRTLAKSSKFAAAAAVAMVMVVAAFQGGQSTMNSPANSRLADADQSTNEPTQARLVEFAASPIDDALQSNTRDLERLQTFVALGDRDNETRTEGGFTPRRVVPTNDVVAISYQPTAMANGVYLGQ
ncbi:MAG: zf-HC2 domain-containing protein [Candidatus Hinthialibacter antarcticus]|nr:zf-HC2 domain-containing protein [Candidatus Hinthialibacter antarcticus]